MSVAFEGDLTIAISAIDVGTYRLETLQHFRGRMAEGVPAAAADNGDLWTPGVEELPRR